MCYACYEDQFLGGLNKFQGYFTNDVDSTASNGATVFTMLPSLHRQSSINIYMSEGSIEKGLLSRKSLLNTTTTVSGRTLLRLAKEVLCNCKKMMALVMARDLLYKDGSFPSGTNWDDNAKWCLVAFYRSEISGMIRADSESTTMNSSAVTSNDRQQIDPATPGDAGQHDSKAATLGGDKEGTPSVASYEVHNRSTRHCQQLWCCASESRFSRSSIDSSIYQMCTRHLA